MVSCANHSNTLAMSIGPSTARSYAHFSWARNVMAITKRRFRQVRCQIELIDAAENGLPARPGRENEPPGSRIKWATAVLGMWELAPPWKTLHSK